MHGTPLLSAKGNHDQDYNSGGSDYDEQAAQHHNQQAQQYTAPPPTQSGGPQHHAPAKTAYNGQQHHAPLPPPPSGTFPPHQQYQLPPHFQAPPPAPEPHFQHPKDNMPSDRGDSKSLGEIGMYFYLLFLYAFLSHQNALESYIATGLFPIAAGPFASAI